MTKSVDPILRLEVPLIVRLGERRMKVRELLQLAPGAIIELPKNAEEDLDLLVKNRLVGGGSAVKVGENFGIRIEWIGEPQERVMAMGPQPTQGPEADDPIDDVEAAAISLLSGQL